MEVIRNKLLTIEGSPYSRKNKCNDGQIKQIRNERRLSSESRSISEDSMEMEMFSESRPVRVKTKQASKNLCISNTKKGSRQHRECPKIGLVKNKRFPTSTSSDSLDFESITEVSRRRKNSYIDSSFLERPSTDKSLKKPNYFDYITGEFFKCSLLKNSSFGTKDNKSIYLDSFLCVRKYCGR
jgi:hypothetical protein